ncbi:MAG: GNAT family N-acetyltransferase [Pseudonocardiales bacterium]
MIGEHGPLLDGERDAAADLLAYAFPDQPGFADRVRQTPAERSFAVRDGGRLASVVLWQVTAITHHDTESTMCLAGPGATHPAARRRGALATAQQSFLAAMREAGCSLSGLETPITRWHRRNGWDVASAVRRYTASPRAFRLLATSAATGRLSFGPSEQTAGTLRQAAARRRFGALRPRSGWTDSPTDLRTDAAVWHQDDEATGLLRYSHRRELAGGGTTIVVHELVALTADAYTGLLTLLGEHNNVSTIIWNAPVDDPLQQLVAEPRDVEPVIVPDKMVRVVDLAKVTVPRLNESSCDGIGVDVHDPQAPWNTGTWRMVADGPVHRFVPDSGPADLQVEVDILGPVLTGHLSATAAAMTGRLRGANSALRRLDQARSGWSPPYCPDTW